MLLYYLFWMFTGFIIHFYIIFGTNPLTQSQCQFMFFPCFRVSQKRKIKRSPIDLKLHGTYFWKDSNPGDLESTSRKLRESHEVGGCAHPLGAPSTLMGPLWLPWRTSSAYIYPYTLKRSGTTIDREFRLQKPP